MALTGHANQDVGKMSVAAALDAPLDPQEFFNQPYTISDDEQMDVSVGQLDGATQGKVADGAQHLGALLDAMIEAGVTADGGQKKNGEVMMIAVLSDGELTPVRRSQRNADVVDVDSLEKVEKRVAIKNLEETQGKSCVNSVCSFSNVRIQKNLEGVGISLGVKENLIRESITLIKDVERDRSKPSSLPNKIENETDIEEDEIDPDIFTLSRLCGDLTEKMMDDDSADLDGVLVNVPIKVAKTKKKKKPLNKNTAVKKKMF
jgi:hypothetical protein